MGFGAGGQADSAEKVARRTKAPLDKAESGLKVGRLLHRYKMGKHYRLRIQDGAFSYRRRPETIDREQPLDGIYVIRSSEPAERMSSEELVRAYKGLAEVERAFGCLKGLDVRIRPIHHRSEQRLRVHIFLCLLAYSVDWHMRKALAPLLFQDEHAEQLRSLRHPVVRATPSAFARRKKQRKVTLEGFAVHGFDTLLAVLGTRCRNLCRAKWDESGATFQADTELTDLQRRALELLDLYPVR